MEKISNTSTLLSSRAAKRKIPISLVIAIVVLVYSARQALIYKNTLILLDATISFTEECIAGNTICGALRATNRNLEESLLKLAKPLSAVIKNSNDYQRLQKDIWPKAQENLAIADKDSEILRQQITETKEFGKALEKAKLIQAEANAELRREYHALGTPKLIYSCNGSLHLIAGKGISNYNSIYLEAKRDCGKDDNFEIIDSEK